MACDIIDLRTGIRYSHAEFMDKLQKGLLDRLIEDKLVSLPNNGVKEVNVVSGGQVTKTLVKDRAYDGTVSQELKEALAEGDLYRETQGFVEGEIKAQDKINELGYEEALSQAISGKITGVERSVILGKELLIRNDAMRAANTADKIAETTRAMAEWMQQLDVIRREQGASGAYWAKFYADNQHIGLKVTDSIRKWEDLANQPIPEDIKKKFYEYDEKIKQHLNEIEELKKQIPNEEMLQAINSIKAQEERKKKSSIKIQGKKLADEFRKLKVEPITLKDEKGNDILDDNGNPVVLQMQGLNFNELIELGAKTIETTANILDGVKTIIEQKLSKEKWYQNLSKEGKEAVEKQLHAGILQAQKKAEKTAEERDIESVTGNPITNALIKELVLKGYDTPETLLEELKKYYPDASDKQVRDMVSKYGKTTQETDNSLQSKVNQIKTIYRLMSAIEDIENKRRPLKTGYQRRQMKPEELSALDLQERKLMTQLREGLKKLNVEQPTLSGQLKTQLDATKSRLKNRIADLDNAIQTQEKLVKKEKAVNTDTEIEQLKSERDRLQKKYNEIFNEPPPTEGERKIEALQRELDNIVQNKVKGSVDKPIYTDAEQKAIDDLKEQITEARDKSGSKKSNFKSVEEIEIENRIKAKQKQIERLNDELNDVPKEQKEAKGVPFSAELDKLNEEYSDLKAQLKQKRADAKIKLTAEERAIKRLEERLDDIRFGNIESAITNERQISDREKELLDEIAEAREMAGLTKAKRTSEEIDIDRLDRAIQDTENLINDNDLAIKEKEAKKEDTEAIKAKRSVLEETRKQLYELRKEAGIIEKERIKLKMKNLAKRKQYYEERRASGDYSKKQPEPLKSTQEMIKLQSEVDKLKFEEQKLMYIAEQKNREWYMKGLDAIKTVWGIPRIFAATGEASFVGMQGRRLMGSYMIKNPKVVLQAFKQAALNFKSADKTEELEQTIKNDPKYHVIKGMGIDFTEQSFKLSAQEENTFANAGKIAWRMLNARTYAALIANAKATGDYSYVKKYDDYNPLVRFERSASGFLNTLRYKAALDAIQVFEENLVDYENNKKVYKAMGNYINTASGRGGLGKFKEAAEELATFFFSPRMFSSELQLSTTPLGIGKIATMGKGNTLAKKEALKHQARYLTSFLGAASSLTFLAYWRMGSTDDNEDGSGVELSPLSTNYMAIVFPNGDKVDLFNGMFRYFILGSRLANQEIKTKEGVLPLAVNYKTPTSGELLANIPLNKINPTLGAFRKISTASYRSLKEANKPDGKKYDDFGNEIVPMDVLLETNKSIYWGQLYDMAQNDPELTEQLAAIAAFTGIISINPKKKKEEKKIPKVTGR